MKKWLVTVALSLAIVVGNTTAEAYSTKDNAKTDYERVTKL